MTVIFVIMVLSLWDLGQGQEVVVQFNKAHYSVNEGGPPVEICIDLVDGAIAFPGLTITVESVAGGTAEAAAFGDFLPIRQPLIFLLGTTQRCFIFLPTLDLCVEDQEDFLIVASSTDNDVQFTATGNQASVYIDDDDTLPVKIVPPPGSVEPNFVVNEGSGFVEVCVQSVFSVSVLKRTVSVMLSTQDGTAIGTSASADYRSEEFTITFEPGDEGTMMCNNIDITDDDTDEGAEDFDLILTTRPEGGTSIANSPGSVLIIDDDVMTISGSNTTPPVAASGSNTSPSATTSTNRSEIETPAPTSPLSQTESETPAPTTSESTLSELATNTGSDSAESAAVSSLPIIAGAGAGGAIIILLLGLISLAIIVYKYKQYQEKKSKTKTQDRRHRTASPIESNSLQLSTSRNPAYHFHQTDPENFPPKPPPNNHNQEPSPAEPAPSSDYYATIT